jgi:RNA-directed DNA polymerase
MDSLVEGAVAVAGIADLCRITKVPPESLQKILARVPKLYDFFVIGKEKKREIRPSREPLKGVQRKLATHFNSSRAFSRYAMGGVSGRSTLDHARPHVGKKMVATLDIRKCFPNTTPAMVSAALRALDVSEEVAALITALTTTDNQVPQGAPTSTAIINIVLARMDKSYASRCSRAGLSYTRYVDDVAISGPRDFRDLRDELIQPIKELGYEASPGKVNFKHDGERQIVTGLVVNDRLRPTKEWIQDLKKLIRRTWVEDLEILSAEHDCLDPFRLHQKIRGRVEHLRNVDPKLGREVHSLTVRTNWPWRSKRGQVSQGTGPETRS